MYVVELGFCFAHPDGGYLEKPGFVREAESKKGVVEALEVLLKYVDPTVMFKEEFQAKRQTKRRGAA